MRLKIPEQPKLFCCDKCDMFFFSISKLQKPTHPKCFGHKTRLATKKEIDQINKVNNTSFIYNKVE
jgi:hypothetical protein